ncbi:MAG: ABC transporter ATP-binding protein/permease [Sphingobacteriales bacterium 17-39-43]|uniref:peptidase domain-containing ABC transporter n=1 Tax=Daejeonella sp. TaxID=2805397 RepID=UPI000BD3067C|nr:ATP-binding cassette domain-containing protein [Daejeonella sp.]OYZ32163.1 MAG: ABC transporter ATP-binding protein/permease [Sphingobacteriales bacterium 16-39-50]OZA25507.1 MAG: ABC transporter ATP-binding protein/permease [Sphingobacteriales bacterium 17-39-43]HQT22226.1 ATP-binding cassette domain-containing protein [Daejeonella sp.]HQT57533.1 ATP-binding cassette domain-containing protein [Daejeonella sp.]
MTPLKRFYNLLKLDRKDVYQIFIYAAFSGLISLSLPLGIQAIVNFIQGGQISVSWKVLILIVTLGVAMVGILTLMQLRITENLQQKIFIRSSFEFAYRLPKISFNALYDEYPPEIANRFFDTLAIQKGTSKLLLDFTTALLQVGLGLILLSLYHPFFILFGIVLLIMLYMIFKFSFDKGLYTSLKESSYKYKVVYWLQEIARNKNSFIKKNNFDYALNKNDKLVNNYLNYREKHFNVIQTQFSQLIIYKVLITAGLLLVGGYLVLDQKMNIGQFVAAEIIILLIINSVEKLIVGLETLYDVLTAVEKIGLVTDLEIYDNNKKPESDLSEIHLTIETADMCFRYPDDDKDTIKGINLKITPGEKVFVAGVNNSGKTTLVRLLSGYLSPSSGIIYMNESVMKRSESGYYKNYTGLVMQDDTLFEGSLLENLTFNNPKVSNEDIKWALDAVGLTVIVKRLPNGLDTIINSDGRHLTRSVIQKIMIARAIISRPKVLFLEEPTISMDPRAARQIIDFLVSPENSWTIIVSSIDEYWKKACNREIDMNNGEIVRDIKTIANA